MTQGPSSNAVTVSPSCAGFLSGHRWEGLQQPVNGCGFFQTLPSIMLVVYVRHTLVHVQYKIPSKQITNEMHFFSWPLLQKQRKCSSWNELLFLLLTVHLSSISSCLRLNSSAASHDSPMSTCDASSFSPGPNTQLITLKMYNVGDYFAKRCLNVLKNVVWNIIFAMHISRQCPFIGLLPHQTTMLKTPKRTSRPVTTLRNTN